MFMGIGLLISQENYSLNNEIIPDEIFPEYSISRYTLIWTSRYILISKNQALQILYHVAIILFIR